MTSTNERMQSDRSGFFGSISPMLVFTGPSFLRSVFPIGGLMPLSDRSEHLSSLS